MVAYLDAQLNPHILSQPDAHFDPHPNLDKYFHLYLEPLTELYGDFNSDLHEH